MNLRMRMASLLMLGLMSMPAVRAEVPAKVQIEVDFLLAYIKGAGCEFYRNGTWHDANAAQAHLSDKYQYLVARDQIKITEDFIEKAATKSSLSGQAYEVRCGGQPTVTSNEWLHAALARFRKTR